VSLNLQFVPHLLVQCVVAALDHRALQGRVPWVVLFHQQVVVAVRPQPVRTHMVCSKSRSKPPPARSSLARPQAHLYAQDGCFSFQLACHRTTSGGRVVSFQDW